MRSFRAVWTYFLIVQLCCTSGTEIMSTTLQVVISSTSKNALITCFYFEKKTSLNNCLSVVVLFEQFLHFEINSISLFSSEFCFAKSKFFVFRFSIWFFIERFVLINFWNDSELWFVSKLAYWNDRDSSRFDNSVSNVDFIFKGSIKHFTTY